MKHKVKIIRFKETGKYYDELDYETDTDYYWDIITELREIFLTDNPNNFIHLMTGEGTEYGVPRIIL